MHYRDAVVWNKAMRLTELVCKQAAHLPREERYGLRAQMTRSAVSLPSNIAEGWTRESRREKAQFLAIAHGSLSELHTQLLLSERIGWLEPERLTESFALIEETSRMLTALRRTMRSTR